MYKSFYNLSERPFQISSDPKFLWLGAKHNEALAVLKYGLIGEKGFLLLTGDVGAGKTTLVNALLKTLDDTVLVANVTDPSLDLIGFLNHIALSFNIPQRFKRKEDFLIYFKDFLQQTCLRNGKQVLLIIDEAHNLSRELLEQIRLLSNIELPEKKLINIFFAGQNELNQKLMTHECRALRQRITLNYNIKPLLETETRQYIKHRLKVAGTKTQLFDGKAIHEIYSFSGGCPRLINMICDRALLTGYVRGQKKITANTIKECSQEVLLPGETKEDLRFDLPQTIRTDSSAPDVESSSITENATADREIGNDDFPLKESKMVNEGMSAKEKSEEKNTRESALRPKIERLISWVLLAASFLKSRTEGLIHRGLTAASCYRTKGKGLIYGALAASVVVLAMPFFSLTYKYFFSRSDHQKLASNAFSTTAPVKSDNARTASAGEQDVVVSTDEEINVRADDEAASAKRSLLELAKEARAENNFSRAVELLEDATARQEGNQKEIKALYVQVIRDQAALLLTKDTDQTEKLLQKAVKADPQNAMTYYDLGKLYSQTKNHLKAINAYKKAADLNSDSANTFFNLGYAYAAIKDYGHAEQMFLRVIDLEPPYLDKAIVNLALVQYTQGKKRQCIENLGKALKVNPDNQRAHKYLEQFTADSGKL
jgi:type II secretory pathway predicted ATPase ExeA/tetratricopeptide (TPR) repeat protein